MNKIGYRPLNGIQGEVEVAAIMILMFDPNSSCQIVLLYFGATCDLCPHLHLVLTRTHVEGASGGASVVQSCYAKMEFKTKVHRLLHLE